MSIYHKHYAEAKKLGEKIGWSQTEINAHAVDGVQVEISELMGQLVDAFINTSPDEITEAGILHGINKSHRYLQAEFWTGMINVMRNYSEQDENMFFDGRNRHCRDILKRMVEAI